LYFLPEPQGHGSLRPISEAGADGAAITGTRAGRLIIEANTSATVALCAGEDGAGSSSGAPSSEISS
jgi:hypothetical protein